MREITAGELSKILEEHKRWCENEDEGEKANLSGANLSDARLSYADLSDAILISADLSGADLSDANLIHANLSHADLRGANLESADLSGADLNEANLSDADLSFANLTQVKNLFINPLSEVKTLYKAELAPELKKQVEDKYPHLLEELEYL